MSILMQRAQEYALNTQMFQRIANKPETPFDELVQEYLDINKPRNRKGR